MPAKKEEKELSFEESLKALEDIVAVLEKGESDLEKSMEMYESGVKLTAKLNRQLKAAKLKIEELKGGNEKS